MPTTVFRNGSLFDGRKHLERGRRGGRDATAGWSAVLADPGDAPHADRTVDLAGGLLAPGFVDAHVHAVQGGLERIRCDLSERHTREDYLAAIAAYADAHPDRPWILGGGWAMAAFPGGTPTAADLDSVVPDRPVFLPNRDHHGAWVNTRALELAGISATTPDPPHGRIERDADGSPTGTLHEGAMQLVTRLVAGHLRTRSTTPASSPDRPTSTRSAITGWQDAIVGDYAGMADVGPTYLRAAQRGDLTGDVVGALWWDRDAGLDQVTSLVERRADYSHGRFRATSVKVMQDGVAENGTAALTSPYLDRCGHADRQRRSLVRRSRGACARRWRCSTPPGSRCMCTRSATAGRARRWTRSKACARPPGPAAPHRPPPAGPPRRRAALRRPGRGRQHAAAVGLPRRPDGRPDAAVPRARAGGLAVPVRCAAPQRRPAGRRQRLAGQHARSAAGHPRRRQPLGLRRGGAGRQRAVPARAGARPRRRRSRRTPRGARG